MAASIPDSKVEVMPFLLGLAWMISTFMVYLFLANVGDRLPGRLKAFLGKWIRWFGILP